jgi:hypothetical protein
MDSTRTWFSKDSGSYASANANRFLDFVVKADASIAVELYAGSDADLFDGSAGSSADAVTTDTWYYLVYTLTFDGTDTAIAGYINGASEHTYTAGGLFVFDGSAAASLKAWLLCSTTVSGTAPAPARLWVGYIYTFRIYNTAMSPT